LVDFTFDYDADGLPEYISAGYTDKTPSPLDYTYDMDSYDPVSGKNPYTFTKGASTSVIIGVDYVGEDQKLGLVYLSPDGGVIESGLANAFQWMPYPDGVHPVYDIYHVGRVDFAGITGYSYYHHYPPGWAKADITFSSIFLYADLRVPVLITLRLQCTDTGSSAYGQRNLYLQTPSGTYYVYGDEHGGLSSCSAYGMTSDGNIYNAPEDETDSRVTSWVVNTHPDYPNVIDTIHISWEEDAPTLLTLQGDPRRMHVACTKDGDVCLAMYVHPIIQAGVPVTDGAHIAFIRDGVTGDVYNLYDYTGIPVPPNTPESPAYYNTRETGFKEIHLLNNPNRETG
jgi:hypothetical protein